MCYKCIIFLCVQIQDDKDLFALRVKQARNLGTAEKRNANSDGRTDGLMTELSEFFLNLKRDEDRILFS